MTVYVDELVDYGRKGQWCHMATDSDDLTELHRLAARIGMKPSWFQPSRTHPHYDLRPSMREKAIAAGAVEVTAFEMVQRCSKLFREKKDGSESKG